MEHNYHGIVLRQRKIGETDRLYTLYTREGGKFSVVGKGVRKMTSKNAPHLEDFMFSHVAVVRGRGLGAIKSSVAEYDFSSLRKNLDALSCAYRVRNYFDRLVDDRQSDHEVFVLYTTYLHLLDHYSFAGTQRATLELMTEAFFVKLYRILGYHFTFGRCAGCHHVFTQADRIDFSATASGLLCQRCARKEDTSIPLSQNVVKVLRLITGHSLKNIVKIRLAHEDVRKLQKCNDHIIQWIMR